MSSIGGFLGTSCVHSSSGRSLLLAILLVTSIRKVNALLDFILLMDVTNKIANTKLLPDAARLPLSS